MTRLLHAKNYFFLFSVAGVIGALLGVMIIGLIVAIIVIMKRQQRQLGKM